MSDGPDIAPLVPVRDSALKYVYKTRGPSGPDIAQLIRTGSHWFSSSSFRGEDV